MAHSIGLALLLGSLAALSLSCEGDCPRQLKTEVKYTGLHGGTGNTRMFGPGAHAVSAGSGAFVPGKPLGASGSCWDSSAASAEPGWQIEGWIDLDGDKLVACRGEGLMDPTICHPDPGDPQGHKEFVVAPKGTTEVLLEFGDP